MMKLKILKYLINNIQRELIAILSEFLFNYSLKILNEFNNVIKKQKLL